MALGLGRLALAPSAFWAMTPRELSAACIGLGLGATAPADGAPPSRAHLADLLTRFPDAPRAPDAP
jgi:uncharacterized phage protein (TIGR02216 family)